MDAESQRERRRGVTHLRFSPVNESLFRSALRKRLQLSRVLVFVIIALGFGTAPLYNDVIMRPSEAALPLVLTIEWICLPMALLAAFVSAYELPRQLTQAIQLSAVIVLLCAILALRSLALAGDMRYPAQMTGVVLIAIAFFGGFTWRRIALGTVVFISLAIALEFRGGSVDAMPLLESYSLGILATIAMLGSYTYERLIRLNWWDMTRLRKARSALRESERRFEAFMDHSPAITWIKDSDSRYVYRNKAHRDRYGVPGEDWSGRTDAEFFPQAATSTYADTDRRVIETGQPIAFETVNHSRDGSVNEWWVEKFPFMDDAGNHFIAGIGVDVGERNRLQRQLREYEERFQAFLDNSPNMYWMKDADGRYLYINHLYKEFLGLSDDSWRGKTDFDLFPPERAQALRDRDLQVLSRGASSETQEDLEDADGILRHWLFMRFCFFDGSGKRFIGAVGADYTLRKQKEDSVRLQSLTDELTGLYNRRGFTMLVGQQFKIAQRKRLPCALLYVDLDNLKTINTHHGHDGGDLAITSVSEALRVAVSSRDLTARFGGDEFVIFAMDCKNADVLVQRVLESVDEYNRSEVLPFQLSVSVGSTSFVADDEDSIERRMAEADQALLDIKRARPRGEG